MGGGLAQRFTPPPAGRPRPPPRGPASIITLPRPPAERDPPGHLAPSGATLKDLHAKAAELLRRAILTLAAWPDREARFFLYRSPMPEPVRDAADAYGYHSGRLRRFQPKPRDYDNCLEALTWLSWLSARPGGENDVRIIVARAYDVPFWQLSQRFAKSEDTLRRWESGAVMAIAARYWQAIERMTR
jgi:hypothetical protein